MKPDDSLDPWIERLNRGDSEAVERVLQSCEPSLRIAVRRRLGRRLRTKVDSMDIVQSVFAGVVPGFRNGGWRFAGRPQVMAFLRRVAWRRLADRHQEHRNALDREQSLADVPDGKIPQTPSPRPSEVAQGHEFWKRILETCPPAHQEAVRLRARGYRIGEIADRTGLHEGSVRRIFYDLARRLSIARRGEAESPDEAS